MPILDTIQGWQVEEGDPIILNGEEVEITGINDDEDTRLVTYYSHATGDTDTGLLVSDNFYDIWGE